LRDVDGRTFDELLEEAQKTFENHITEFIKDNKDIIDASSGRAIIQLKNITIGKFSLSGSVIIEATSNDINLKVEGAVNFKIVGCDLKGANATLEVGLRLSYNLAKISNGDININISPTNISSLNLAVNAKLKFSDNFEASMQIRKYLYDINNNFSWKDLVAKDWVVGGEANFGRIRYAGRFNISQWLGYGK
jgi:hypothetical protein